MEDKLPQIWLETGISQDYINAYASVLFCIPKTSEDREFIAENVRNHPIQHYADYFSSRGYECVLDDRTAGTVRKLDRLADLANETLVDPKKCTETAVRGIVSSAGDLIYGKEITYKFVKEVIDKY